MGHRRVDGAFIVAESSVRPVPAWLFRCAEQIEDSVGIERSIPMSYLCHTSEMTDLDTIRFASVETGCEHTLRSRSAIASSAMMP